MFVVVKVSFKTSELFPIKSNTPGHASRLRRGSGIHRKVPFEELCSAMETSGGGLIAILSSEAKTGGFKMQVTGWWM